MFAKQNRSKEMNKIEWIAKNSRHGDITRCASTYKYDKDYLREVSKGRRNNADMVDNLVEFIKTMRKVEQVELVDNHLLDEVEQPITQA